MNVKKLVDELAAIEKAPNPQYVTVQTRNVYKTIFEFSQATPYYYPLGIVRMELQRGGAGVVYVYTTAARDPHLTIPFDSNGANFHWTDGQQQRGFNYPECIARFLSLFP